MDDIIRVKDLYKTFKTYERGNTFAETTKSLFVRKARIVEAVKHISFGVGRGEILGFIGPNGAGKSTTLKMLTGILYPTAGEINILGYCPWRDRKKYVRKIGAVFGQKSQLMWDIPPLDAFHLNQAIYNIEPDAFQRRLDQMTGMLGITELAKKPTRQLSLGERMKCEFVMAMLHGPEIVFLDEPTIGLDLLAKDVIREFIRSMNEKGTTFILTTHDMGDIDKLARRVIMINHGQIAFDGSIQTLKGMAGGRKTLTILTQNPITDLSIRGVEDAQMHSSFEAVFTIDTEKTVLNAFIAEMNERYGIKDIQIDELPIEQVIRRLYTEA